MNRQFPPEIIQPIVEASLDRYDVFGDISSDVKLRYRTLKSYSLLNSTWRGISDAKLVEWVEFHKEEAANKFLELARQRGGSVEGVKDMYIESGLFMDSLPVTMLLRSTPQLINFCYADGTIDVDDLAQLQTLRRHDSLQHLSIANCRFDNSALQFFTPAFLPQLRHLESDSDAYEYFAPLIPQLEIIDCGSKLNNTVLAHAKSLLLLPFPYDQTLERHDMLSTLPSPPPFLHIHFCPEYFQGFQALLGDALEDLLETTKTGLRVIILNDWEFSDAINSRIQQLEESGVRVQLADWCLKFKGAIIEMEKIREEEKRATEALDGEGDDE